MDSLTFQDSVAALKRERDSLQAVVKKDTVDVSDDIIVKTPLGNIGLGTLCLIVVVLFIMWVLS